MKTKKWNEDFIMIAGGMLAADAEKTAFREDVAAGKFKYSQLQTDALISMQKRHHREGYRSMELVRSMHGWTIRSATGLENFCILYRADDFADAVRWARALAAERYGKVEIYVSRAEVERAVVALGQTDEIPAFSRRKFGPLEALRAAVEFASA